MRPRRDEDAKTNAKKTFQFFFSSRLPSRLRVFTVAFFLLIARTIPTLAAGRAGPFILGADISWMPEDEADGAEYFDKGLKKDIFQILKDHHFNYIRLRVFVDPQAPLGYAAWLCRGAKPSLLRSRARSGDGQTRQGRGHGFADRRITRASAHSSGSQRATAKRCSTKTARTRAAVRRRTS
jgi:hypothetical protein